MIMAEICYEGNQSVNRMILKFVCRIISPRLNDAFGQLAIGIMIMAMSCCILIIMIMTVIYYGGNERVNTMI